MLKTILLHFSNPILLGYRTGKATGMYFRFFGNMNIGDQATPILHTLQPSAPYPTTIHTSSSLQDAQYPNSILHLPLSLLRWYNTQHPGHRHLPPTSTRQIISSIPYGNGNVALEDPTHTRLNSCAMGRAGLFVHTRAIECGRHISMIEV